MKTCLKNRADSSANNNLFAELWVRDTEEGVSFRNVIGQIIFGQGTTWKQISTIYFFRKIHHWRERKSKVSGVVPGVEFRMP